MNDRATQDVTSIVPHEVAAIGGRLESSAKDFGDRVAHIMADLADTTEDETAPVRPYAADPRNEPAQPVAQRHEDAVEAARELLSSLKTRLASVGSATANVSDELTSRDKQLAADIDRTRQG